MAQTPGPELDRPRFARRLRTLEADAFEAFVADCWRARGWDVEREGDTLTVVHPTLGDRRTLSIHADPWWRPWATSLAPADVGSDVVVLNRPVSGDSEAVVDAGDLHEMLQYGVGSGNRAALFETYFDRPGSPIARAIHRLPSEARLTPVMVAAALTILLVAAAGVGLPQGDQPAPGSAGAEKDGSLPEVERTTPDLSATRWPGGGEGFPPGLEYDGISDPSTLAATHVERASDRSYTLVLTVRETEDGRTVGTYRERIAVRERERFAASVKSSGTVHGDHPALASVDLYSAGAGLHVRAPDGRPIDGEAAAGASPGDLAGIEDRVRRHLETALSVNESAVVETRQIGDTTIHRLEASDRLAGGGTERVSALVSAGGTVHEIRVERSVPGTDRRTVVELQYLFGPVVVDPPRWVANDSITVG